MAEVRKFIIIENQIMMGLVEYHKQLIPESMSNIKPIGGGRWEWNDELYPNKVFFFGSSHDYGKVTEEQIKEAWNNSWISPFIEDCEIVFSTKEYFSQVLIEKEL